MITSISKYQKPFIKRSLYFLSENTIKNTEIICRYILVEQNDINTKESTKEEKIRLL